MTNLLLGILQVNENFASDMSRLLILFSSYSQKYNNYIAGTTKVVKLDFFVRYPTVLAEALRAEKRNVKLIKIKKIEKVLVESAMIRYLFGPWDNRYWSILSTLESLNLIQIKKNNRTTYFQITELGQNTVDQLSDDKIFEDYFRRSELVVLKFGKLTASGLVQKIYKLRPELKRMDLGEEIRP